MTSPFQDNLPLRFENLVVLLVRSLFLPRVLWRVLLCVGSGERQRMQVPRQLAPNALPFARFLLNSFNRLFAPSTSCHRAIQRVKNHGPPDHETNINSVYLPKLVAQGLFRKFCKVQVLSFPNQNLISVLLVAMLHVNVRVRSGLTLTQTLMARGEPDKVRVKGCHVLFFECDSNSHPQ